MFASVTRLFGSYRRRQQLATVIHLAASRIGLCFKREYRSDRTLEPLIAVDAVCKARQALEAAISWLERPALAITDMEKSVRTWHLTLATMAAEISGDALTLAQADRLRTTRMLNRSLLEYACRAHYYHRAPEKAAEDTSFAENMFRKLMHPRRDVRGDLTEKEFKDFRRRMSVGNRQISYPIVQNMMRDMLVNFGLKSDRVREYLKWLDVEYTIGSGLIHGSQVAVFDAFIAKDATTYERCESSRHFNKSTEIARTAYCLFVLVAAFEMHYKEDFGIKALVARYSGLLLDRNSTTIWQHDALQSLL
jgi:hypothetical protein